MFRTVAFEAGFFSTAGDPEGFFSIVCFTCFGAIVTGTIGLACKMAHYKHSSRSRKYQWIDVYTPEQ